MSLISTQFNEEKTKYIGFFEAAGGIGTMIGPPMGGFLYGYLHYAWTFYFFSAVIGLCLLFNLWFVPNQLNNRTDFTLDKNMLVTGFLPYSQSYMNMSVLTRNNQVQKHNFKNIIANMENTAANRELVHNSLHLNPTQRDSSNQPDSNKETEVYIDPNKLKIEHCNLLHIKDIKFMTILKCKESNLALIASAIGMYNICFFTPYLSV